jgi:hypothetical protein
MYDVEEHWLDWALARRAPSPAARGQARVKIYPDAAHGFLFQHHAEFAADVMTFLTAPG